MTKELSYWEKEYGVTYEDDLANNLYLNFGIFVLRQQVDHCLYDVDGYDSYGDLYRRSPAGRALIDSCIEEIKKTEFAIVDDGLNEYIFNPKYLYILKDIVLSVEDFEAVENESPKETPLTPLPIFHAWGDDEEDDDFEEEEELEEEKLEDVEPPYGLDFVSPLTIEEQIKAMLRQMKFLGFVTPHEDSTDDKKIPDEEFEVLKKEIKFVIGQQSEVSNLTPMEIYYPYFDQLKTETDFIAFIIDAKIIDVSPEIHSKYDVSYLLDQNNKLFFSFEKADG